MNKKIVHRGIDYLRRIQRQAYPSYNKYLSSSSSRNIRFTLPYLSKRPLNFSNAYNFSKQCKNNPGKQCQNASECSNNDGKSSCSSSGSAMPSQIPQQNLQIHHQEVKLGEQAMDCYETKDAISVISHQLIDDMKGAKLSQTGQLYALMFTCGQCNTKGIKSFTKNAYHHGVVLIRCDGCDAVHLVADNLGWFEDDAKNLDSYTKEGESMKKVYDPVAVVKFLKTAFGKKQENPQTLSAQTPNNDKQEQKN